MILIPKSNKFHYPFVLNIFTNLCYMLWFWFHGLNILWRSSYPDIYGLFCAKVSNQHWFMTSAKCSVPSSQHYISGLFLKLSGALYKMAGEFSTTSLTKIFSSSTSRLCPSLPGIRNFKHWFYLKLGESTVNNKWNTMAMKSHPSKECTEWPDELQIKRVKTPVPTSHIRTFLWQYFQQKLSSTGIRSTE